MTEQTPFIGEAAINALGAIGVTSDIVQAYVGKNPVSAADLPSLIGQVHAAVTAIYTGATTQAEPEVQQPAVPVRKSVTPDFIICLEDGKKFKSLKRHLRQHFNLSPEEYRTKWGLPDDYPMVSPNYSAARSNLAKASGLGTKGVSH